MDTLDFNPQKRLNEIGCLFDLDGVLIDSETEYTQIWTDIEKQFPTGIENFARKIKGRTLPEILNKYFSEFNRGEIIELLNKREQRMRYEWLPGAQELLIALNDADISCALVTSSNELKMRHLREEQPSLEDYFKAIITADKIQHSKPDPEGYLLGASLLGKDPNHCLVFEDSLQGVMAGKAAGAFVVGLTTTLTAEEIMPYSNLIVPNLSQIDLNELFTLLEFER